MLNKIGELYNEINLIQKPKDDLYKNVAVGSKIMGYDSKALNEVFSKMVTKSVLRDHSLNENLAFLTTIVKLGFKPVTIERVEAYVVELLLQPGTQPTDKMLGLYLRSV